MTDPTETPEELIHVIYASRATQPFSNESLITLLDQARSNNEPKGLTGMLLHCEDSFFQVLEGDKTLVRELYEKIAVDPRHDSLTKIIEEAIPEQVFTDWSMGFKSASRADVEKLDGMNDFYRSKSCLIEVDEGRARKLLGAFGKGRWRATG